MVRMRLLWVVSPALIPQKLESSDDAWKTNHPKAIDIYSVSHRNADCACSLPGEADIGTGRRGIQWDGRCLPMFPPAIYLILNSLFFTLRLSGGGGSFPRPLKAEEEREYLERCAQGDLEARNVLVEHNLRLVAHIVKKYYAQTGDQDDLISIGTIGLIKGISTFKADKNVRLATYASRCIENEILMHFRAQKKLQGEVSLTETLESGGGGDGNSLSLMDVIAADDDMLEELDTRDACQKVRECVRTCLTPRERTIITLRYGLGSQPPQTQREIAARCGISRSYVSRIEKRALAKLGEAMEGWGPAG